MNSQPQQGYPMPDPNLNDYSQMTAQPIVGLQKRVPPGLEYLSSVDQLLIHQKIETMEVSLGWESENKYVVKNTLGQQVYFASEESKLWMRMCCAPNRAFTMKIADNNNQEVMTIIRPFLVGRGHPTEIKSSTGNIIGYLTQDATFTPKFKVKSPQMEIVFRIEGPLLATNIGGDVNFKILTPDKSHEIGKIRKQWGGVAREMFTDADNYSVSFPMDLDVNYKACLLAAVFLIDMRCYESNN